MTVRIELKRVEDISAKIKGGEVTLAMKLPACNDGDIARLSYLSRQGVPLTAIIESPQAEMDLLVRTIEVTTGEIDGPVDEVTIE